MPFLSIGNVLRVEKHETAVDLFCEHGCASVSVLGPALVRVRATQAGGWGPDFSYAIAKRNWPKTPVTIATGKVITLTTKKLVVRISKSPLRIEFATPDGQIINRDEIGRGMGWDGPKCRTHRELQPGEMFFGCGEKTGPFNKRGQTFGFWNSDVPNHTYLNGEVYVSIPFLISTRPGAHYGIFFDNSHRSFFNLGQTLDEKHYTLEAEAGELDYYFFTGTALPDVVRAYTQLTGQMWLPPKWALGFHQCRWSYKSADEILQIAREFRDRNIPCNVIYCDIDYMDGFRVWTWDPKTFPNPREMISQLAEQGFKLVTIIDPGVKNDDNARVCREGKEQGMFLKNPDGQWFTGTVWPGECVFPDFTSARVREWWGQWHKEYTDLGVAGFWNDMNEPAVWNHPGGTMPAEIPFEYDGQWATHARAHNVYGFNMARACHEELRQLRPGERPFVITRAAYAGIQRYSMVWTGDNHSTWEQFAVSIPECLNLSLSGVPFCGPDVGGFQWNCTGELLARWTQAGAFFPFFRNHTARDTFPQEPWTRGPEVESICRRYISLRYQLLPYFYNLFREAALDGTPIMRPLFWEFPADAHGYTVDDQFLLGPSLLIAPVLKAQARQRTVYLPPGSDWYDYWTKQKYPGGQFITVTAPLDTLPLFVRAGTILPLIEVMNHTAERPVTEVTLDIYPGEKTTGVLYEDDGQSFDYEQGRYSLTQFEWTGGKLRTTKKKDNYPGAAKSHRVMLLGKSV